MFFVVNKFIPIKKTSKILLERRRRLGIGVLLLVLASRNGYRSRQQEGRAVVAISWGSCGSQSDPPFQRMDENTRNVLAILAKRSKEADKLSAKPTPPAIHNGGDDHQPLAEGAARVLKIHGIYPRIRCVQ